MLVMDLRTGVTVELGEQDCGVATVPASTFKVPHALLALHTGVVSDPDAVVPWDGTEMWLDAWERDHSLRTAIYESVVWYFQRTARLIGEPRMSELLRALDYGNADSSSGIDSFWLDDGSLKLTGYDQLEFFAALYRGTLPIGAAHTALVQAMIVRPPRSFQARLLKGHTVPEVSPALVFAAKTGTASVGKGSVTWLAGHARCGADDPGYVFVSRVLADEGVSASSPAASHGLATLAELGRLTC